ncbi:hypothetical protein SAMN05443633_10831 [Chryseobacterium arachidis]|uniref:Uncharacterized protein n=1 Tax=Chryseobacterium arachidis TaxID=1416778 RepID=A0A1M5FIP8_9FLAO|nr:hypothetical protein [Chryseobacterium arachidis]SHF91289.1 hypothetical protein SAMN05443633_10831 [Chryseobacterium arachidis]
MGDWNTLHHFDDKKFYSKIVPDLLGEGQLLRNYFNSKFGKYIVYDNDQDERRIKDIIEFSQSLDDEFKIHETLLNIQKREKNVDVEYSSFIQKRNKDEDDFYTINGQVIEDFNLILTLIIFSECAAFNPHLILGRTIFTGCVNAKQESIAEYIISDFTSNDLGSIFSNYNGFINWVTNEDLQLLWLDKENLYSAGEDADKYFSDFYKFIEIAIENDLGVISGKNMNEGFLKLIQSPLSVKIDVKELGLENVINYG